MLLLGRHDYWPGYTPDVIRALDFNLWPHLALTCDAMTEQREQQQRELEASRSRRRG